MLEPFPDLPTELVKLILRFCEPATLAQTCLCSLALLELSASTLYHDVHARGARRVGQLLCTKGPSSELNRLLSLHHIQHLTLSIETASPWDPSYQSTLALSQARIDGDHYPFPLSTLTLHLPSSRWAGPSCAYDNWSTFLHWFAPVIVTLIHRPPTVSFRSSHRGTFGPFAIGLPAWPTLERLVVEGFGDTVEDKATDWYRMLGSLDQADEGVDVAVVFAAALGTTENKAAEMLKKAEPLFDNSFRRVRAVVVETVDLWREEKIQTCLNLAWGGEEAARRRGRVHFEAVDTPFADLYPKPIDFIPWSPP